ncbi:hypothetical protein R83H12_01131 [Fibrobacteria bacterium R8-3-H12]
MKRGISLIAVLMFILAATTACVVISRMVGLENFSSGSRLKASEAYQASESGIDAVRAWLGNNAYDASALIEKYSKEKVPISMKNAIGESVGNKQKFNVYLKGMDNKSKPIKLKFLSIGESRDGSKVSQTAILSVEGLYNLNLQGNKQRSPINYDEDFWGNMGSANELAMMNAVITNTTNTNYSGGQALNKITIGTQEKSGYLILDGSFFPLDMKVYGDVYSTGDFDYCEGNTGVNFITGNIYVDGVFHPRFKMNIGGDAFFKGGVDPNTHLPNVSCIYGVNGMVAIDGNSTIEGDYFYYNNSNGSSVGFHVKKNLVMDNGSITLTRASNSNDDSLAVYGNVCIKNDFAGTPINTPDKTIPFFGNDASSTIILPGTWTSSSNGSITTFTNGSFKIRSKSSSLSSGNCLKSWGADPMDGSKTDKNWKAKIINEEDGRRGCENTPIQFDMAIYEEVKKTAPANWVHRKNKPGACNKFNNSTMLLADENMWVDLGVELQDCYTKAGAAGELRDGWLVVYIKDKTQFSGAKAIESGKYIIVFDLTPNIEQNKSIYLPQTNNNAQIMLYLPNGFIGNNCRLMLNNSANCPGVCDSYNYFIFSDNDITEFNTNGNKLHGNIFMNNCSIMNTLTTGGTSTLNTKSNSEFVEALMDEGILCNYGSGECGFAGGTGGVGTGGGGSADENIIEDKVYIATASKLSVRLESKDISKETLRETAVELTPSIIVMPRVVRLIPGQVTSMTELKNYYGYIYLNKAETIPPVPNPTCEGPGNNFSAAGLYVCKFTNGNGNGTPVSDFYVLVGAAFP